MPFVKGHKPYKKGEKMVPVDQPVVAEVETKIVEREEIAQAKEVAGDVTFFAELDMNDRGKIMAAYPAWFDRKRIFNLKEDIRRDETAIEKGWTNQASLGEFKQNLARKKEALARVEDAQAKVTAKIGKDFVAQTVGSLGEKIAAANPSRYEDEKGFTDPHSLAEKWTQPCVELSQEELKLAHLANIPITGKKATLVGATMAWQMGRKFLGEDANADRLRRER